MKKIGIDLDNTILSCKLLIYKLIDKFQIVNNSDNSYIQIDKNAETETFLNKLTIFNPNVYIAFPNAIETINYLYSKGIEIHLISSRPNILPIIDLTINWLNKNNVLYNKLILGCSNKAEYVVANQLDLMIDDNLKTCKSLAQKNIQSILFKHNISNEKFISYDNKINSSLITIMRSWSKINDHLLKIPNYHNNFIRLE